MKELKKYLPEPKTIPAIVVIAAFSAVVLGPWALTTVAKIKSKTQGGAA